MNETPQKASTLRPTNTHMALEYYKAALRGEAPRYVPSRVYLRNRIHGDGPFRSTWVDSGEHDCSSNSWGALSVRAANGRMLGIKPTECEPVEWREASDPKGADSVGRGSRSGTASSNPKN
jgi:hypothetical protein